MDCSLYVYEERMFPAERRYATADIECLLDTIYVYSLVD